VILSPAVAWAILAATGLVLGLLLPFAFHRLHLLRLAAGAGPRKGGQFREGSGVSRGFEAAPRSGGGTLPPNASVPRITVQLPIYNEATVVERLLDAAALLDHPQELLEIQVLDDSDDETAIRARERVELWRSRGVRMRHLRRGTREGFKAGALQWGMERAEGELLLVLDSDFVPPPDLIRRLLSPFADPGVGMVQARWDHLNETESLLTRCQALLLDAHFFLEQGGRHRSGCFMNFNGTAGMWRRAALEDAGGWSADTLTEDLDVSYRAQMAGWRFVFLPEVGVPAELPSETRALEVQQKRWAQGGIQTGRKLLGSLWRGPWPLRVKAEGTVHLLGHLAHPLTLALGVLLFPSALARDALGLRHLLVLDLLVFSLATLSFLTFYVTAGRMRGRPWLRLVPTAVATLCLGVGLTAAVSRSVLRGLRSGVSDPFRRTPKRGGGAVPRYSPPSEAGDTALRLLLLAWMAGSIAVALAEGYLSSLPFLLLFAVGWAWMGWGSGISMEVPPVSEARTRGRVDSRTRAGARLEAS
jgi:cellulose synthase/poly-beta-1,6-N-acetylglucosamine synthase-like glycosyltransferase